MMSGEELRDKLLGVKNSVREIPMGILNLHIANLVAYQGRCENDKKENPNYQCVRELLAETIEELAKELDSREEKYLGR